MDVPSLTWGDLVDVWWLQALRVVYIFHSWSARCYISCCMTSVPPLMKVPTAFESLKCFTKSFPSAWVISLSQAFSCILVGRGPGIWCRALLGEAQLLLTSLEGILLFAAGSPNPGPGIWERLSCPLRNALHIDPYQSQAPLEQLGFSVHRS